LQEKNQKNSQKRVIKQKNILLFFVFFNKTSPIIDRYLWRLIDIHSDLWLFSIIFNYFANLFGLFEILYISLHKNIFVMKLFEDNRLKEVLNVVGITQAKLARLCEDYAESISVGTINKICTRNISPSERHKNIIVKVINKYLKEEKYSVKDIF